MAFDLQPYLEGQLVNLRPLQEKDFDCLFSVASDPLIWKQHPEKERYKLDNFSRFFKESLESESALVVMEKNNNRIIGSSRFHGYDEAENEIEIGWTFLSREYWGGEYNKELKKLMHEHAFQVVEKVVFIVGHDNLRSQRAVEKIGGVRAGSRLDGNGQESFAYIVSASAFE